MYFSIRLRFSPSFDHSARIATTLDTVSVWDGGNPALELMKVQCFCSENTHTHACFPRPPALHRPQVGGVAKWIEMMVLCFFGQTRQHPIGGQIFLFFLLSRHHLRHKPCCFSLPSPRSFLHLCPVHRSHTTRSSYLHGIGINFHFSPSLSQCNPLLSSF